MPDPQFVRTLLARYATARIALAQDSGPQWEQELDDVTYTLCVATGSRSIGDALAAADAYLEQSAAAKAPAPGPHPGLAARTSTDADDSTLAA
ncbi:DUF5133 domain-containing protein [Streptomyces sp. CB00455]|uniref:DUF5133 domain-containing protein n=1 Tax=Streptomyces sp. CB00455 TaxID=1703927 RepID=UPI001F5B75C0|nr:DUF5133 domain-containing protein [Streptomyces sp. CB00455]